MSINNGMYDENYSSHYSLAELHFNRAIGKAPEMESSKAMAKLISKNYNNGDSIADIGCSAGHYLFSIRKELANKEVNYTGVEFHDLLLSKAQEAWNGDNFAKFRKGSIFEIPASDKEFDITFCSNLLMHLPTIVKPLQELIRITRKKLLIRTYIGTKSFKIQEVKNNSFWPGTEIAPANEFNDDGVPMLFEYENIWSKDYFESVVRRFAPTANIKFIKDDLYDIKAIEETAKTGNLPNPTRTLGEWQIFDYILLPYHFIEIEI